MVGTLSPGSEPGRTWGSPYEFPLTLQLQSCAAACLWPENSCFIYFVQVYACTPVGGLVSYWLLCHSKSLLSVFFFNLNQLKVIFNHSSILPFNVSLLLVIPKWLSAAYSCVSYSASLWQSVWSPMWPGPFLFVASLPPCLPDGFLLPHNPSRFSAFILVASFKNVLCTWEIPNRLVTFKIVHCYPHPIITTGVYWVLTMCQELFNMQEMI